MPFLSFMQNNKNNAMIRDLILGYKSYGKAIRFIGKHKLYYYFLLPIFLFVGIYYLGVSLEEWKVEASHTNSEEGFWLKIWYAIIYGFYTVMAYLVFKFMRYILIIALSPVLSIVSERVEQILTGNRYKFNLKQLIKDIKRTISLSIRNLMWEFGIIYSLYLIVSLFSWVFSIPSDIEYYIDTTIAMFVGFYYYGFSFIDYMNERRRLTIAQSVVFVKKHKAFAFALGSIFTVLFHYSNRYFSSAKDDLSSDAFLFVVVFLSIIMSMIPIITIVAATLGVHELVDLNVNKHANIDEDEESNVKQLE